MTYEEAIEILQEEHDYCQEMNYVVKALEVAIKALEKQMPKKPIEDCCYDEPCVCPNCGCDVINQADNDYQFEHCYHCGQSLDWSDTK